MYVCGVLVAQSCLTFFDPMNCTPPSFSVHGIFHAGTLDGLPFPIPGELPDPGIGPASLASPALVGGSFPLAYASCMGILWV